MSKKKNDNEDIENESLSADDVGLDHKAKKRLKRILRVSENDLDGAEEADLQEAIHKHLMEYASKKKLEERTVDDLTQVLEEYLSTFL